MKRRIEFNDGVILGEDMRIIVVILPSLKSNFNQRKQYDEYYFNSKEIELSLWQIDRLSEEFNITISRDELCIY